MHAGAIPNDSQGTAADILVTNVGGTWHVLLAAQQVGMRRVVSFSSIQVFGCSAGEGEPDYLPIDDDHPRRAARPYGNSKRLGEDLCDAWSAQTGIPTVTLRPPTVLGEEPFGRIDPGDLERRAFVHVDDVADAVVRAVTVPVDGHLTLLLSATGDIDAGRAREVLGWKPVRVRSRRQQLRRLLRR